MKKVTKDENKKSEKKVQIKKELSAKKGKGLKVSFPNDWCLCSKYKACFLWYLKTDMKNFCRGLPWLFLTGV